MGVGGEEGRSSEMDEKEGYTTKKKRISYILFIIFLKRILFRKYVI